MSFANSYLAKQKEFKQVNNKIPDNNLRFIIIIPCCNEPFILNTLNSLYNCSLTNSSIELIIVVNSSEESSDDVKDQNIKTITDIKRWEKVNNPFFPISIIHKPNLPKKFAGAGLARKIGMDEAIGRFNLINHPGGVLISLDADTEVEPDYLCEIERFYFNNPNANGCSIYFEHPTVGNDYDENVYNSIILYELYLRYYVQSLRYIGYPFSFHTVGSCFTVNAQTYIKQGGMNKKQAGEDFYFLHKVIPQGGFYDLCATCVYPSPRISDRVPFGTGPIIKKIIENKFTLLTYHQNAFNDIRHLIELKDSFFDKGETDIINLLEDLPGILKEYLISVNFIKEIDRINTNCANIGSYRKHFFCWFNAFKVLKFLNYSHDGVYKKIDIEIASLNLLQKIHHNIKSELSARELLNVYRNIEKNELKKFSQ